MVDTPYSDVRREALDALAAGEPQRAFALFRWALEYPGTLLSDEAWRMFGNVFLPGRLERRWRNRLPSN